MIKTIFETTQGTQHETWIEIRRAQLSSNLKAIQNAAAAGTETLAVVKSNAYGHGLREVATTIASQVSYLGVSSVQEVLELREHGIEKPIFLFGRTFASRLPALANKNVTLSVSSLEEAAEISDFALSNGQPIKVHVKIDTGMGRMGLPLKTAAGTIEKMASLTGIILEGILTHCPTAEREDGFTEKQIANFTALCETLAKKGIHFRYRHAANSTVNLKTKTPALNLIRPGIMLYGIYNDPSQHSQIDLKPILHLRSRVILTKQLKAGETSGYGRDFVAEKPTTIAVLPIGYSHGYPFTASNRASVLYHGKRYRLAGRVSMDYLVFDLGTDSAKVGDEVTLLGQDGHDWITPEELSKWSGTISYEVVTRLMPKIPRLYC